MTEERERNIYTHVCFASIISGVSLILSIIAILIWKCNYKPMSWDFANSIIAILSILVTVLIGWQIWNIIDFNNRVNAKIQESESKLKEEFRLEKNDILSKAKEKMKIYVNNKFMEENRRRALWDMYNSSMQFLNTQDFDTAFRLFCDVAKRAYRDSEKEIMDNALYMAETITNISDGDFTPNNRAFKFYENIEETFKKINTERANKILDFAREHYGNLSKNQDRKI